MGNKEMFVLAVTLITWAGVFVYLLRLDGIAKKLERELKYREEESPRATAWESEGRNDSVVEGESLPRACRSSKKQTKIKCCPSL